MEKYTQILARLQPGQSIARCEQGFQLKEGKAALSIVFPRVESLLIWFDREYPAKQAGAVEAPETGFHPYSLTCSCGRTLEGSTEAKGTAVYCECGQGIALSPQLVGHEFEPILNEHEQGIALSFEFMDEDSEPILNEYGHDLRKYLRDGWDDDRLHEWADCLAIDQDGEMFQYEGTPCPYGESWYSDVHPEVFYVLTAPIVGINWHHLIWQRPQK